MKAIIASLLVAAFTAVPLAANPMAAAQTGAVKSTQADGNVGLQYQDTDGDGVCDNREPALAVAVPAAAVQDDTDDPSGVDHEIVSQYPLHKNCQYLDADRDGICDFCGSRCSGGHRQESGRGYGYGYGGGCRGQR